MDICTYNIELLGRRAALLITLMSLVSLHVFAQDKTETTTGKQKEESALVLAVMNDSLPTRLALTLANPGKEILRTDAIGTERSRLILTAPDGRVVEHACVAREVREHNSTVVKSSQSTTSYEDISGILRAHSLKKSGAYRIRWKLDEQVSNEVVVQVQPVSLSVALIADSSPTMLRFTITNSGEKPILTTPIGTSWNQIVAVRLDGEEVEMSAWVRVKAEDIITIQPLETRTWDVNIGDRLKEFGLSLSNVSRIYWRVYDYVSPSIIVAAPKTEVGK